MSFEIQSFSKIRAIRIINEKGDYIDLDLPNKDAFEQVKKFLEDSDL